MLCVTSHYEYTEVHSSCSSRHARMCVTATASFLSGLVPTVNSIYIAERCSQAISRARTNNQERGLVRTRCNGLSQLSLTFMQARLKFPEGYAPRNCISGMAVPTFACISCYELLESINKTLQGIRYPEVTNSPSCAVIWGHAQVPRRYPKASSSARSSQRCSRLSICQVLDSRADRPSK